MKHFYFLRNMMCLLLTFLGIHAYAQESITVAGSAIPVAGIQTVNVTDEPESAYSGLDAKFSIEAVTEALGISAITEATEYIVNPSDWSAVENTSDGWRQGNGDLCGWVDITEETRGYCVKIQEPESGLVDYLGAHHNGVWNEGDTFTAYWGFVANNKAALVKVVVEFETPSIIVGGVKVPIVLTVPVEVKDKPSATYSGLTAKFDAAAVAAALGVDSLSLAKQYIVNVTTFEAVDNTSDGWRNGAGDLCGWVDITEESRGYCVKISEPNTGLVDYLGAHHNGVWAEDDLFSALWGFVANDKAAVIQVDVLFTSDSTSTEEPEVPEVELPNPETTIANLEIVGQASYKHERYYTQGYDADSHLVISTDIAEKLGLTKAELQGVFSKMVYVDQYSEGSNTGTLNLLTVSDGWMRSYIDKDTDEKTGDMVGDQYSNGGVEVYLQQMAYVNDSITFIMGQYPDRLSLGDTRSARLYVVYGSKAYLINYAVSFVEPPYNGLEEMTRVGGETIAVSQQPTNDYSAVSFTLDLDAIAALLGAENTTDIQMKGLTENGGLSDETTANNGGWWLDANGAVTQWANGTFYTEPTANKTWTEFHVGQKPDVCTPGNEYSAKLYLIYGQNYYEVIVNFTITEAEEIVDPNELHVVATRTITIAQELNTDYAWSEGVAIPNEYLIETIGTTEPHLYGLSKESTDEEPIYTDDYSCDPKPGYWMTADGKVTKWGSESPWGISIAVQESNESLIFNAIQFQSGTAVGDSYKGSFFLANTEDGAMLQVNVIYNIVESVAAYETVGEKTIVMKVSDSEDHMELPLAEIATLLGYESEDELLNAECLSALTETGVFGDYYKPANGLTLTEQGYVAENANVGVYFDSGMIYTYCNAEQAPTEWKIETELCFENEGKRYVIYITLCSEDIYVGINSLSASAKTATYDLMGRQVKKAQKGIFIQNGKKYIK